MTSDVGSCKEFCGRLIVVSATLHLLWRSTSSDSVGKACLTRSVSSSDLLERSAECLPPASLKNCSWNLLKLLSAGGLTLYKSLNLRWTQIMDSNHECHGLSFPLYDNHFTDRADHVIKPAVRYLWLGCAHNSCQWNRVTTPSYLWPFLKRRCLNPWNYFQSILNK
jgi:hypothetical protein